MLKPLEWIQENEKLQLFVPNAGQSAWIDEIKRPGGYIILNGGGNGSGKSYGLIAIFAAFMWPNLAAACFDHPVFKDWKYPKRARIASTPKELESIGSLQTSIEELFPKGRYEAIKNGKSFFSQFVTDTGWTLDLFSYEQNKAEMAGPTIGLMGWNEPMPEELWREGIARTRKGALILGALTSLSDETWLVDGILSKANGQDIRVVYSDVESNCKQHAVGGTLEHEHIAKILSQYDPDELESRKTGKPLQLSGRILKAFDRNVHVLKERPTLPQDCLIYQVLDPAIAKPIACIYAFVDRAGVVTIYDEWPEFDFQGSKDSNMTVKEYGELFKSRENGRKVHERIIDRHFAGVRRTLGGETLKEEFGAIGFDFTDSYHVAEGVAEVETGILKLKEYLRYDSTKAMDSLNRPKLQIAPNCTNTIKALERWSRDPRTGKPLEEFKDFVDVCRYLVMANPEIEAPQSWGKGQKPYWGVS